MGLETATWISELTTSNPPSSDNVSQGDDHIRLLKTVLQATFPNAGKAFYFQDAAAKTASYTVLSTDQHKWFTGSAASGAVDFTLPSLASGDAGWSTVIRCIDLTNAMRIVPASGTINGTSSFSFSFSGQVAIVWWSGSTWYSFHHIPLDIHGTTALTAPATDDEAVVYDASASANRRITLADLLKVLNVFTEDTSPDSSADFLLTYDTSASAIKKVKPANLATSKPTPDFQTFLSGTSQTYTTPTSGGNLPLYLRVRMIGGGGGGGGSGGGNGSGGDGADTSFSDWTAAKGLAGGAATGAGGAPGSGGSGGTDGTGTKICRVGGASGIGIGGPGGGSKYGGAGNASLGGSNAGGNGRTNTGSGGGGGSSGGGGGGAGEYVEFVITAPASSYTYTVGSGGTAGAGANGGGTGAAGRIEVDAHWQ